jgi:hypothetical protein
MALPTTNLTLHLDASDTDRLFTTWVNGGSHTGTPSDGSVVQAWTVEADGSYQPAHAAYEGSGGPAYRSVTPLMLLPCLDFGASAMSMVDNTGINSYRNSSDFVSTTAKTIILAAYFEAIASTATDAYDNEGVIGGNAWFGMFVKNDGGQRKVLWTAYDGAWGDVAEQNISLATTHIICARHDGTNLYLSVDGGSEHTVANGTTSNNAGEFRIARSIGSLASNVRIGEIAVYNSALTGTPLSDAKAYFAAKWQGAGGGSGILRMMNHY